MSFVLHKKNRALGFNVSRVRFLILHYTALPFEDSLRVLTQGGAHGMVSVHYLVPDTGNSVYNLVEESDVAWHAGVSAWKGRLNINDTSIGIEIVNRGVVEGQWFSFPEHQIQIVIELAQDIIKRYSILPQHVLGHSDIAPGRKQDPGPLFPWKKLYNHGVGAWWDEDNLTQAEAQEARSKIKDIAWLQKNLKRYGYGIQEITGLLDIFTQSVIASFQMHFQPENFSGIPDEQTCLRLASLVKKYSET